MTTDELISTLEQLLKQRNEKVKARQTNSKTVNYIVTTQGFSGKKITECETEQEAWGGFG